MSQGGGQSALKRCCLHSKLPTENGVIILFKEELEFNVEGDGIH